MNGDVPDHCRPGAISPRRPRTALKLLAVLVLLALPVRLYLALTATMLSRDGVTFIWYAQHLAENPLAEMRQQDQHPLYPAMILGAHWVVQHVGGVLRPLSASVGAVLDDPVQSWTLAGMSVTLLGGLAVVVALYLVTARLFDRRTGLLAAVLAALAAEFCQLSADALTDMPHLALYLFALYAALRSLFPDLRPPVIRGGWGGGTEARVPHPFKDGGAIVACPTKSVCSLPWLILAGLLSGLAFLMRPEGAAAAIAAAIGALALTRPWSFRRRFLAALTIAVAAAFVATPYMGITGQLVRKKSLFQFFGSASTVSASEARDPWAHATEVGSAGVVDAHAPTGRCESSHGWSKLGSASAEPRRTTPVVTDIHVDAQPPRQGRREPFSILNSQFPIRPPRRAPFSLLTSHFSLSPVCAGLNPFKSAGLIVERWGRALRVTPLLLAIAWLILRKRHPVHLPAARLLSIAAFLHILVLFALIRGFNYADEFSVRHTMILAGLTLPFAAAGLAIILDFIPTHRRAPAAVLIILGLVAPTLPWMLDPRNAADAHLRRAGEWIRAQQPTGAKIHTEQHPAVFYATGQRLWSPREHDTARILEHARVHRPDWLVFDLRRAQKACPGFPADLEASAAPGELELADVEEHFAKGRSQFALVYRYHPPP